MACSLLAGGAALHAYHYVGGAFPSVSGASVRVAAAPPVVVQAASAVVRDLPVEVTGLGTVQPLNSVTVKPRVGGQIVEIAFAEGQAVRRGDVLARLDPRPFQSPLHQAEANLSKDKAQLVSITADLGRTTKLAQNGFATGQALDSQTAQQAGLTATIKADEAAVETAQLQLDYTTVTSPIDGVAGIRMIDAGNVIATSDPGIVVVNQLDPISVVFTVPSSAVAAWPVGKPPADVAVAALSANAATTLATGTLALVDNRIDAATATIKLKAAFPNGTGVLKPGQFVNARFDAEVLRGVLTVPAGAVQRSTAGPFVYAVDANSTLAQRPVTVGRTVGAVAVISDGLAAGDVVVTDGQYGLKPGLKVSPTVAAAPAAQLAQAGTTGARP